MAHFKTAYGQREIIVDAKVTVACKVGDYVKLDTSVTPNTLAKSTIANATHIVAQSDMTLEYGHIPVESRDYRYSPNVATSTAVKKVALFQIIDKSDIIPDADGTDHA